MGLGPQWPLARTLRQGVVLEWERGLGSLVIWGVLLLAELRRQGLSSPATIRRQGQEQGQVQSFPLELGDA